jgi:hypothetical protein
MKTYTSFLYRLAEFLAWEIFQTQVVEKIETHFIFNNVFRNRALREKMWKNIVEPDRPQMTIWRLHIACWIPKATDTLSEYVILLTFRLQQWLHEGASVLRYTYIASPVELNTTVG